MTTDTDNTWLRRITALLAQAESTNSAEEAETFMAKAQQLMERHAIDEAALDAAGRKTDDPIERLVVTIEAPYASAKSSLLAGIAKVNRVRCISHGGANPDIILFGFRSDIAAATTLYASLSLQGARALSREVIPADETPRRFRHAFMLGFAGRIYQRLDEGAKAAATEYRAETGQSAALVLVPRQEAVDREFAEAFPNVRTKRSSASSRSGYSSGSAAANRANLGQRGVAGGGRRALGA